MCYPYLINNIFLIRWMSFVITFDILFSEFYIIKKNINEPQAQWISV